MALVPLTAEQKALLVKALTAYAVSFSPVSGARESDSRAAYDLLLTIEHARAVKVLTPIGKREGGQ